METREKVELALIPSVALLAGAGVVAGLLPSSLSLGELVLVGAAGMLGQGLIRDVHLKYLAKVEPEAACALTPGAPRGASFCMESTLGVFAIAVGAALLFSGNQTSLPMEGAAWPLGLLGLGVLGFFLKDVVIDFRKRSLRIEKAHRNVVFW